MTWHTIHSELSTSSQEREGESSLTFCLATYLSELARSRSTPAESSFSASETASSPISPSGTTSAPSTESPGEGSSTSSTPDFLAKTYRSQTQTAKDSMESDQGYGMKPFDLFAKLDRSTSTWKTVGDLFQMELDELSASFPKSGMWDLTQCWEATRQALVPTDYAPGFTLQRPTATDGKRFKEYKLSSLVRPHHSNGNLAEQLAQRGMRRLTPECAEILMRWPEGWTDLKPLETVKIQSWQQQHG